MELSNLNDYLRLLKKENAKLRERCLFLEQESEELKRKLGICPARKRERIVVSFRKAQQS